MFEKYYYHDEDIPISTNLKIALHFIVALGILSYVSKIKDKEFEMIGLSILDDVYEFVENTMIY